MRELTSMDEDTMVVDNTALLCVIRVRRFQICKSAHIFVCSSTLPHLCNVALFRQDRITQLGKCAAFVTNSKLEENSAE
jgi:hypothetical protein